MDPNADTYTLNEMLVTELVGIWEWERRIGKRRGGKERRKGRGGEEMIDRRIRAEDRSEDKEKKRR